MNEERFEGDLRVVLDEMAPADVPAQLRAIVAAVSRQRPARRSARKGPAVRVLLVAAIIVVGSALLVSAGGLYHTAQPSPSGEESAAVASSSPTAPPTDTPTATPLPPVDQSAAADQAGMFAGGLWAIRGSTLFISTDAGATWHTGTIPMAPGPGLVTPFVLDPEHAWLVTPGPDSTPQASQGYPTDVLSLVIDRTTDGGRTWQQSTAPGNYAGTGQSLVFVDALHGFLMCSATRQSDTGLSTVLRTDDGGRTWTVAGTGDWLGSMFAASDAHTLWAGAEQDAGPVVRPILDVSRDGGRTWGTAALPGLVGPSNQGGAMHYLTEPPVFLDANNGIVAIAANNPTGPVTTFYRTTDGGRTWSKTGDRGADVSYGPAVLDARDWLAPVQYSTSLWATSDAGKTWHTVITSGLPGDAFQVTWIGGLDATHAAALVGGGSGAELLITADAGRSWKLAVLEPTPASTTGP